MFRKINVLNIVRDHISTLRDYKTKKVSISDLFLFSLSPALISVLFLVFSGVMDETMVTLLTTSLSIFAALLFNLLLIIYDAVRKEESLNSANNLRKPYLKEVFNNISFCILTSVLAIVLLLIYSQVSIFFLQYLLTFFSYYLVALFILTLFMVLKRTHILLSKEIET